MVPVLGVLALWVLFGGTHVALASGRVRATLVGRLGEWGFMLLFSLVAALSFSALVSFYAAHCFEGPAGPSLGAVPALRWALIGVVATGVVLITASLVVYPRSPMALFNESVRSPRGLERVTRHPFFVGVALLGAAHALLATRLVGAVAMGGLALFALLGVWHQDRKLLRLRGEPYAAYLAATSATPFAAIVAGRQRLEWGELPFGAFALGALFVITLRTVHASIFARGGIWVIATVLGGAALATLASVRRAGRRAKPIRREGRAAWLGVFFVLTAVGHAVIGLAIFRDPLAAIVRDGFVNGVEPALLERGLLPYFDREAAFWFMLYAPILLLIGFVTRRALELGDAVMLRLVGWTLLVMGGAGALAMPISGFWIVLLLGGLVLRAARRDVRTPLVAARQLSRP
jgi:uncharacterized membrane protein